MQASWFHATSGQPPSADTCAGRAKQQHAAGGPRQRAAWGAGRQKQNGGSFHPASHWARVRCAGARSSGRVSRLRRLGASSRAGASGGATS